ncbi:MULTISPECIES: hypothetical protein [unclassified Neochlamydia]|uniref:hypothetical protein n=1 Tax=unclassified Neochlamydia TaxID=2643326 RepID=UPI001BC8EA42|nr:MULTISPECIES: hypothetical protein [unclassified Neochlamydia]MBS4166340.1 Uncharacterized protein [Neochlamydia sp. AcF65]
MLKDATYKEKSTLLISWMPQIIEEVKKDLKHEHLKNDFKFVKKYFLGKNLNKLTNEEIVKAYTLALEQEENGEKIAEFIINRWLLKNAELYDYFERALLQISNDFTQLTEIDTDKSQEIVGGAVSQYGAVRTYLFSVMNSVVFPKEIYEKLNKLAEEEQKALAAVGNAQDEHSSQQSLKDYYEKQLARLVDKYEKKLIGMQKKYIQDTESLKKQMALLQKRLNG